MDGSHDSFYFKAAESPVRQHQALVQQQTPCCCLKQVRCFSKVPAIIVISHRQFKKLNFMMILFTDSPAVIAYWTIRYWFIHLYLACLLGPITPCLHNCNMFFARSELPEEKENIYKEVEKEIGRDILEMSTVTENGIMDVKVGFVLTTPQIDCTFFRQFKILALWFECWKVKNYAR